MIITLIENCRNIVELHHGYLGCVPQQTVLEMFRRLGPQLEVSSKFKYLINLLSNQF